jgi:hypothetical protein
MINNPLIILIPEEWELKRDIRSPKNLYKEFTYGKTFDETYDYDTLFCGAFKIGNKAILLSPPMLNIKKFIQDNVEVTDGVNPIKLEYCELDRCEITVADIDDESNSIQFFYNGKMSLEVILDTPSKKYENKKIVFTMQKNETLENIRTYATYYKKIFDIDAVIIFDNQSTHYTLEDIDAELSNVDVDVEVINWSMSHGPIGPPWDSEFGRICAFQYLKYKFAFDSKCVVNLDIDEMLISENTLDEIVDSMIDQNIDTIQVQSKNISRYTNKEGKEYSIKNYFYYHEKDNEIDGERSSMVKWITLPKYSRQYCWTTHFVYSPSSVQADEIYYAHMWILCSPNHMDDNSGTTVKDQRFIIHDSGYIEDVHLKENLQRI